MIYEIELPIKPRCYNKETAFRQEVSKNLNIDQDSIQHIEIIKRSIDGRSRYPLYRIQMKVYTSPDKYVEPFKNIALPKRLQGKKVIVCGAGPAGLFAAYTLAMNGHKPIIIERGKDVHRRKKDVGLLCQEGIINTESNYCFGEGGAGCFSDGKLYTRSSKRGDVQHVLDILVHFGADPSILYDARPHIGSDRLPVVVENMRNAIILAGGEVYFDTRVEDFIIDKDCCIGVVDQNGKEYRGEGVILACGHSAEDIYQWFHKNNYAIVGKDWAMGVRLEHPQELVDRIQYGGKLSSEVALPAAEYGFVEQVNGRGVFTFCMCPGGMIIPSMTAENRFLVNGMSGSKRLSPWANTGVIVTVHQSDALEYKEEYGPLAGLKYQQSLEESFFAKYGVNAPVQRLVDFLENKESSSITTTSYPLKNYSAPLHEMLPEFITKALQAGISSYASKKEGYLSQEAMLVGLESRTSSTVVLPRDKESYEHIDIKMLYPCGEGAGYAGGITSSAVDGVNCAQNLLWTLKKKIKNSMNL